MLNIGHDSGPKPCCQVTSLKLSNYINHSDPPKKKKPFSIILNQTYSHTLDLLLSETTFSSFQQQQNIPSPTTTTTSKDGGTNSSNTLHYAKVHLKLLEIITGSFFTTYIKTPSPTSSSLLMLSSGRPGIDETCFRLQNGTLSLEMCKPIYEKSGLQGTAIPSHGKKHIKQRFLVEIDLRGPNMVSGKKGFERVKWAFQNVEELRETKTWLLVRDSFTSTSTSAMKNFDEEMESGPLAEFAPVGRHVEPIVETMNGVSVPSWPSEEEISAEAYAETAELLEWIGLAMMGSPRIFKDDDVDPYLCRYQVPSTFGHGAQGTQNLVRLRWRGMVCPSFAQKVFLAALKSARGEDWFAMSATAFDAEAYTILVNKDHSIAWEYKD